MSMKSSDVPQPEASGNFTSAAENETEGASADDSNGAAGLLGHVFDAFFSPVFQQQFAHVH